MTELVLHIGDPKTGSSPIKVQTVREVFAQFPKPKSLRPMPP